MDTQKIGIREFRDNLANYLLESEQPVTITRHGDTVGVYIPLRRKRSDAEWGAFEEAAKAFQKSMVAEGITEEDFMDDIKRLRTEQVR